MKNKKDNGLYVKPQTINWVESNCLKTYWNEEQKKINEQKAIESQETINQMFEDFKINARCVGYTVGPSVTRLLIDYKSIGTIKSVEKLTIDVARLFNGVSIRFTETVPGSKYSAFEIPNAVCSIVSFKEALGALPPIDRHPLIIPFGKDIDNKVVFGCINDFPHMLIAGSSGSGKSVFMNVLINSLITRISPKDLKLVLVDPRKVEFNRYKNMPHLLCPLVNDADMAVSVLEILFEKVSERYNLFEEANNAINIKEYNAWAIKHKKDTLPYIVVVLDEFSELVYTNKGIISPVVSLCQKARAAGVHVIVSTQRASTDVITGTIKANLTTRIAFTTASIIDSMVILDEGSATELLGCGDMLLRSYSTYRDGLIRIQSPYITSLEIETIVNYLKDHYETKYDESFLNLDSTKSIKEQGEVPDDKYCLVRVWAKSQEYVSMSKVQKEFAIGFNRAGNYIYRLQQEGIISSDKSPMNKGYKVIKNT